MTLPTTTLNAAGGCFRPTRRLSWAALAVFGAALAWAYAPTLADFERRWATDPQYAHGYLVPGFALFLLWWRRGLLVAAVARPGCVGLGLLAVGTALRLAGAYGHVPWAEGISLLPCLAGLAALLGGLPALRWAWPAVAFLGFMVPLPYRLETALAGPLRGLATAASAYALETLGLPAVAEGNVIALDGLRIGVVEACNGLSMLVTFFALTTALVLVVRRPALDRALLLASAVPIALVANVARITATGVVLATAGSRAATAVFHDWAGWFMMPLALLLLGLEVRFLAALLVGPGPRRPVSVPLRAEPIGPARVRRPDGLPVAAG